MEENTLVDNIWKKIKNNKFLAIIIIIGAVVVSISSFSDSILRLSKTADDLIENAQKVKILDTDNNSSIDSSSFENYRNATFKIAADEGSDIVNISKEKIIVDFSINNEKGDFSYSLRQKKEHIEINPFNRYLTQLKEGGPIGPIGYWYTPFEFQFPTLDFKIVNNSDKTVYFTKAIFTISKSQSDPFPILLIRGTGYNMKFPLTNIGWGNVYNCRIIFNLVPTDRTINFGQSYQHELLLGEFERYAECDLSSFFAELGVDIKTIREHGYLKHYENGEEKNRILKALGPFKDGIAIMYGEIFYEGLNAGGKMSKDRVKFQAEIDLGGPGVGVPMPPSFIYDVSFEADKEKYEKTVALSQAIKAGEFDRFNIKISAPKSSRHAFDLSLVYNDNRKLVIPNVFLNYFMSKDDYKYITKEKSSDKR
jgi:hypothetical protein